MEMAPLHRPDTGGELGLSLRFIRHFDMDTPAKPIWRDLERAHADPDAIRTRRVIDVALAGRVLDREWFCMGCAFRPRGVSEQAVLAALDAHWRYVNAHADRATDPHFELDRMDNLLGPGLVD